MAVAASVWLATLVLATLSATGACLFTRPSPDATARDVVYGYSTLVATAADFAVTTVTVGLPVTMLRWGSALHFLGGSSGPDVLRGAHECM